MPEPEDQIRRYAEAVAATVPPADGPRSGATPSGPRRRRPVWAVAAVALVVVAIGAVAIALRPAGDEPVATDGAPDPAPVDGAPDPATDPDDLPYGLARCDPDAPGIAAPADRYRDEPVYVENEMPIAEVQAWAREQPGFVTLWIDRDRNGWITVAFTEDVDQRQADLDAAFPDDGVVAVEVDWTLADLEQLRTAATDALVASGTPPTGSGIYESRGMVGLELGALREDALAALAPFAGPRLCVTGIDPSEVVPDGPPTSEGDGWRLLGWDLTGMAYRTGIATDPEQYAALWATAGLPGDPAPVDFAAEVVIWFGSVYGSGCETRLDDVVVDVERQLVHGTYVLPGAPRGCNADARPKSYLVALERAGLPGAPFAIQLDADGPPRGVPEERTVVTADLRSPGAVATADQVGPDPELVGEVPRGQPGGP